MLLIWTGRWRLVMFKGNVCQFIQEDEEGMYMDVFGREHHVRLVCPD
jgi:hypothetical protein